MIPRSLSASSLNVAELCMARWKAENFHYSKGMGGFAANLGTSVHGALEAFVKATRTELGGNPAMATMQVLEMMYRTSYMETFNTSDPTGDLYDEGLAMLEGWLKRTDWTGITVLSCEVKETFMVKTSAGEIPFNYIWDRHDDMGDGVYRVVDYKTNAWAINPGDLKKKIQARCYGLAAQIKHPDAKKIWVQFDMLRHDPVGIVYTREDNIATWKFIKELAEKIIATPEDKVRETLNPECRFCVRKQECKSLTKNIATGGVFSVTGAADAVDRRAVLEYQLKAIQSAIGELDEIILTEARATDVLEFETEQNRMSISVSSRRNVDAERVRMVIGDDLFEKYGSLGFTVGSLDKLVKGKDLTDAQKAELKGLVYMKKGEPKVNVSAKNSLEEDS